MINLTACAFGPLCISVPATNTPMIPHWQYSCGMFLLKLKNVAISFELCSSTVPQPACDITKSEDVELQYGA